MFSLETIQQLNREAETSARIKGKVPYIPVNPEEAESWPPFPFPSLGIVPVGWVEKERWFVDKTGVGSPYEPALTHEQFTQHIQDWVQDHPHHGYAIVDEGQFQLYIVALEKEN